MHIQKNIKIGSKHYLMESDDEYLAQIHHEFEPHMVKLFDTLLSQDDHVIDVGANIGCTSLLFAQLAKKVFSFEPSLSTFKLLQQNVFHSEHANIDIYNLGLAKKKFYSTLAFSPQNRSGGFIANKVHIKDGYVAENVNLTTGDAFFRKQKTPVNFIKIDVEGFEMDVLTGFKKTLKVFQPIVVLELNHWCLNAFQRISIPDFFDFLRNIFPFLYAVEANTCKNLHEKNAAYEVAYHHIINNFAYSNIVGAFDKNKIHRFLSNYSEDIKPEIQTWGKMLAEITALKASDKTV